VAGDIRRLVAGTPRVNMLAPRTLEQQLTTAVAPRRLQTLLLLFFAALTLTLALVGTAGLLSHAVAERTREIGVRIALGAGRRGILSMILGHAAVLVGVGLAAGLVASWGLSRFVGALLYRVAPTDPATYAAAGALFVFASLLAAYFPARRAVDVSPLEAMRYE